MYNEEGFIYASFDPQITKDGSIANIHLEITENPRARIHKVHITGNTRTREKIIRRQILISPGDYFQQSFVQRSHMNIHNLGFFDPATMGLDYEPINFFGDIDLTFMVEDRATGSINGGVGYNSRDRFVWQASIAHNNLFGNFWQGNLQWEGSGVTQNIDFSFTNPFFLDTDLLVGFNIYHAHRDWANYNYRLRQQGGGFRIGYPVRFIDHTRMIFGYSLFTRDYNYLRNGDLLENMTPTLRRLIMEGRQFTSTASFTLMRDSRDNVFFPTSGSRVLSNTQLAGGPFGGDFDFVRQITEVSWFTPAFGDFVFRTKWRMGFIESFAGSDIPPDERFFLGGTGPDGIRGFPDRSIAPDRFEGGTRSIIFSNELGVPITSDQLVGIVFFDSGATFNSFNEFNFRDFNFGAGIGIRFRSPIGLLGFDYAYRFRDCARTGLRRGGEPHFQLGTTF
jgi:outer membrane protein insertion porin family